MFLRKILKVTQHSYDSVYLLTPWCRTIYEKLIRAQLVKKYPTFLMEPEGSPLRSQKPATGPHPEPAESSSPPRPYLPKVQLNVTHLPTHRSSQWSLTFGPHKQKPASKVQAV